MADKRINALTTTSASVGDDYFAIDGATNGTRALSAFSPSFGGNATVTGTLTVSGVLSSTSSTSDYGWNITSSGVGGPFVTLDATNATASNRFTGLLLKNNGTLQWTAQLRAGDGNFHIYDAVRSVSTLTIAPGALNGVAGISTFAGAVAITSTTASTSTSSGALVVSGGVGVAGAINVGASGLSLFAGNADTSIQVGAVAPYQRATVGITRRLNYGDVLFGRNLQGKTSSDNYTTVGTDTSGGGYGGFEVQFGGVARILLGTGNTTQGSDVTPTVALSASTTNATFIGSVTTAAPAGGTAAAWKLGTVATVSPTSPNRTIEVDIGGTIYYIHAKTTNN